MKHTNSLLSKLTRGAMLALTVFATLHQTPAAFAAAVATDSRNGAWGTAYSNEGTPSQQVTRAINRAIAFGGNATYIRSYQFTVPAGCYVAYATGYVSGKGWCGNWSIDPNLNVALQKACDGLLRQGATRVVLQKYWQE
jgi:hypothetical protein